MGPFSSLKLGDSPGTPSLDDLPSMFGNFHAIASRSTTQLNSPAVQQSLAREQQTLRQQQLAKGINNPMKLVNLQAQLHQKQITPQQFMQSFGKAAKGATGANNTNQAPAKIKTGIAALPGVVNEQDIQPVKNTLVTAANKAKSQFKYLSGPTSTPQQRQSIMANQEAAAKSKAAPAFTGVRGGNSAQGLIQAHKLAATGASPTTVLAFLHHDSQKLAAQTKQGVNTAATIAGFSAPGEGILAKGTGALLDKTGTLAALGKDKSVNDLISNAVTSKLTETGQKAAQKSGVGQSAIMGAQRRESAKIGVGQKAIQGAKTQKIPVISPTETAATRSKVGGVAVENANRTRIPIQGKSTQVSGKVTIPSDRQYLTESNKLTTRYNNELAVIRDKTAGPIQKILQQHLDDKYSALQEQLDKEHGKTSASFTGKEKTIPEPKPAKATPSPSKSSPAITKPVAETAAKGTEPVPKTSSPKLTGSKPASVTDLKMVKGGAETAPSQTSVKVKAQAVEHGINEDLGPAKEHGVMNIKEQAGKAADLVNTDDQKANDVALGKRAAPSGTHPMAVFNAVKAKAIQEGNVEMLRQLKDSKLLDSATAGGQTLRVLREGSNAADPLKAMQDIIDSRTAVAQKTLKQPVAKAITQTAKEIDSNIKPVSIKTWSDFVESIKC